MFNFRHIQEDHAFYNIPLTFEEAYEFGLFLLGKCEQDKELDLQAQRAIGLCALSNKSLYEWKWDKKDEERHGHRVPESAAEQIAGICSAIIENDISVSRFGFLDPNVPYAIDNSGTGEGFVSTANISTIAAFIAVAAGIPMCKHGSSADIVEGHHKDSDTFSSYGSSDFISLICGIDSYASKEEVERCVEQVGFGYTDVLDTRYKRFHSQVYKTLRLSCMDDLIRPMTNPLNPQKLTRRVLGVNSLIPPRVVAESYRILNDKKITCLRRGVFVRGFISANRRIDGVMDEVSICAGGTQVVELQNDEVSEYNLFANDFGIEEIPAEAVSPIGNKGEYSLKILKGEISGSRLSIVLVNAAILFYLDGKSDDLRECYKMAEESFRSGKAYQVMLAVREAIPLEFDCF